jgi:hypothetical protein
VDFEELRAIGIEHPAVVSYELEAAGVPIIQTRGSNRRALAIEQLIDPVEGAAEGAPGVPGEGPPTPASSSPARSSLALQLRARVAGRLRVILAWRSGPHGMAAGNGAPRGHGKDRPSRRAHRDARSRRGIDGGHRNAPVR